LPLARIFQTTNSSRSRVDVPANTWNPKLKKGVSDFDTHGLLTTDWVYALPVGRGKAWVRVKVAAEVYNVTNTNRFDVSLNGLNARAASPNLGNYTANLSEYRRMQFGLRTEF